MLRRVKRLNKNLLEPLQNIKFVNRDLLIPNDYNPNRVSRQNLELLTTSIMINGFTLPIVVRPDMTIIDGFHRWTVCGKEWTFVPRVKGIEGNETLYERLEAIVPISIVSHEDNSMYIYGTVTHNRARGTHLLEPMKAIVKRLIDEGKTIDEIGKQLGMKAEEVFRLSDFTREDFLEMMVKGHEYSKAEFITQL